MEIKEQLLQELSHFNMHYVAEAIGGDMNKFDIIMSLLLYENDPVPPRAGWIAEIITQKYPQNINPYLDKLINKLGKFTHPGSRRNSLKILMRTEIPEDLQGPLIDICFEWILSPERTVAVKVFAMQIIQNHLPMYPELAYELRGVIEDQWEKNSIGFKSRGRKVLKETERYM